MLNFSGNGMEKKIKVLIEATELSYWTIQEISWKLIEVSQVSCWTIQEISWKNNEILIEVSDFSCWAIQEISRYTKEEPLTS